MSFCAYESRTFTRSGRKLLKSSDQSDSGTNERSRISSAFTAIFDLYSLGATPPSWRLSAFDINAKFASELTPSSPRRSAVASKPLKFQPQSDEDSRCAPICRLISVICALMSDLFDLELIAQLVDHVERSPLDRFVDQQHPPGVFLFFHYTTDSSMPI